MHSYVVCHFTHTHLFLVTYLSRSSSFTFSSSPMQTVFVCIPIPFVSPDSPFDLSPFEHQYGGTTYPPTYS